MKYILTTTILLCIGNVFAQYVTVWSDEFSDSTLDNTKWAYETGGNGWGNNELQYYTTNATNLQVNNGELTIIALEETIGNNPFTSAKIFTKGLMSIRYGKIEARIKSPMGQGLWPAFWMLGTNIDIVSWPKCGEIDIMEHINSETETHGTAHWDNSGHAYYGSPVTHSPENYHVYSIEWDATKIEWFVDGNSFHTMNITNGINSTSEFHETFYLILNLAVGGNWPGYPNSSTVFPAELKVDYVRVFKDQSELSVDELQLSQLSIAPNPATNEIHIRNLASGVQKTLKIVNVFGQICSSKILFDDETIFDIAHLSPGVYFMQQKTADGKQSRTKFIIE